MKTVPGVVWTCFNAAETLLNVSNGLDKSEIRNDVHIESDSNIIWWCGLVLGTEMMEYRHFLTSSARSWIVLKGNWSKKYSGIFNVTFMNFPVINNMNNYNCYFIVTMNSFMSHVTFIYGCIIWCFQKLDLITLFACVLSCSWLINFLLKKRELFWLNGQRNAPVAIKTSREKTQKKPYKLLCSFASSTYRQTEGKRSSSI